MMLTEERAKVLSDYLMADEARMEMLMTLSPEEAADKLKAEGMDFSVEEITEFGAQVQKAAMNSQEGELDEEALGEVSGGVVSVAAAGVYLTCVGVGIKLGSAAAKNWKW